MDRKKLLIATDTFPPRVDGVNKVLLSLIPKLKQHFDITVLAPNFGVIPKIRELEGVEVILFPMRKKRWGDFHLTKPSFRKIRQKVKESDLVFVQSIAMIGLYTIICAHFLKKKVVCFTHVIEWQVAMKNVGFKGFTGYIYNFIILNLARILYNWCTLIITPSAEISEIYSVHGIRTIKEVIPLGIDNEKFNLPADRRAAKRALGINPDNIVIGYCGRLSKEKDLPTLSRAFSRLRKSYANVVLMIVGDGLEEIRKLFVSKENVFFAGVVHDTAVYYHAMDIFVMPSLTETSSLATMEAMACSVAVVSTPVGNIRDYLKNYQTGLIFKKKNSFDLARKLEILINNKALREQLAINGYKMIVENYDWNKCVESIENKLLSLAYEPASESASKPSESEIKKSEESQAEPAENPESKNPA